MGFTLRQNKNSTKKLSAIAEEELNASFAFSRQIRKKEDCIQERWSDWKAHCHLVLL
jgi:hypothetical protein